MSKAKNIDMLNGPLFWDLIRYSIPTIAIGIVGTLYNAADTAVLGIFGGTEAMAGVGSTGSLYGMAMSLFLGYTSGVGIVIGRAFGKKDKDEIHKVVHTSIASCLLFGMLIAVLGTVFSKQLLQFTAVPENVMSEANAYNIIIFLSSPLFLAYSGISTILRANGDAKRPMYISFISGGLNVLLNVFFVVVLDMTAAGVALATAICHIFTVVCGTVLLVREKGDAHFFIRKLKIHRQQFLQICRVGFPMGFQTLIFSFANVIVQSSVNGLGDAAIAGNSSGGSVANLFYTALNAISAASIAFISQNYGARKYGRIKKIVLYSIGITFIIWAIEAIIAVLFGRSLVWMYTPQDAAAIACGYQKVIWVGAFYGLCGLTEIFTGAARAIGYNISPTVISIVGVCGLRILWVYTAFEVVGTLPILYLCYPLSWLATTVAGAIVFLIGYKKLAKAERVQEGIA